jgi:hypothetical protein
MSFRPNVHDELTLNGITYRIAEHPAAPGMPYGQEGRAGIVYCLETLTPSPSPAQPPGVGVRAALKVFKPRFRMPYLVSQAEKLAAFADLPGLQAARRRVLTRVQNPDLLQQHPDLIYAVLMPWIEGPTWLEVLLEKRPLSPQQALHMARGLAQVLEVLELRGLAHCDLSAPNVMLPLLAGGTGVELVDLEGLYAPGMTRPQELSSGSAGYAHRQARGGLWGPEADRFAGAVLLAEMLGWCDPQVVQATWGESYFAPQEMQQDTPRYRTLVAALERRWGSNVARLFERAWRSDSLLDCPTFGEWMVALPLTPSPQPPSPLPQAGEGKGVAAQPPGEEVRAAVDATAEIRAFMQAARRMEDKGNLEGALELYRQALELAQSDPSLRSLAREIELIVQDVEKRIAAQPSRPQPAISPLPMGVPFGEDKGPGVRADTPLPSGEWPGVRAEGPGARGKRPWRWLAAALVILSLLAAIVYGMNLQRQQTAQATATTIAWQEQNTATAQAQAAATARIRATQTAAVQATTIARAQAWRIAFHSDRDGNWEIYVMNADGSGVTRLTNNPAVDWNASWSPDGKYIAFVSERDGDREIYVMNADGSRVTRLTNHPNWDEFPAWSPDGKRIAFQSYRDGNWEIYVMNTNGSGQANLTNNPALDWFPSWSPDGKYIAFVSERDGNEEIYVMNADGSGVTRLTNNPAVDDLPSWSPDGKYIAFVSERDGDREIYVMNADGSGVTRLTNNPAEDWFPSWSPDGKLIAFVSNRDGNWEIYVMNADGSGLTRLTNNPAEDWFPSWSPAP